MSSITLQRRTNHKLKPQQSLTGFSLDFAINVPDVDIAFVHDLNGKTNAQPWDTTSLFDALRVEFERHMREHFGATPGFLKP
jgi:hypothetical protein